MFLGEGGVDFHFFMVCGFYGLWFLFGLIPRGSPRLCLVLFWIHILLCSFFAKPSREVDLDVAIPAFADKLDQRHRALPIPPRLCSSTRIRHRTTTLHPWEIPHGDRPGAEMSNVLFINIKFPMDRRASSLTSLALQAVRVWLKW